MTATDKTLTEEIAAWAVGVSAASLPSDVKTHVRTLLLDFAGLCVAARQTDYVEAIIATAEPGPCTLIGRLERADPYSAALLNGTAAHGEDFDDTFERGPVHTGTVVIPAILAAAERFGLTGEATMAGMAVGLETLCRLSLVAPTALHRAGFHPTAVLGTVAAAAGTGRALNLTPQQIAWSMGVSGSMASGIIEYLADGSWTKRMHAGWSAQSGLRASLMARHGFVGPRSVLEGAHGVYKAFGPSRVPDFGVLTKGLGEEWLLPSIGLKTFACGAMTQPYVECSIELCARGVSIHDIVSITCKVAEGTVHRLWEPLALKHAPPTGYAAKFSGPYCMAVAFCDGAAGLAQFTDDRAADPEVLSLARKIRFVVDPENPYPSRFTGHLQAELTDGSTVEITRVDLRGGANRPLTKAEIRAKYSRNTDFGGWSRQVSERLEEFCNDFDAKPDLSELFMVGSGR